MSRQLAAFFVTSVAISMRVLLITAAPPPWSNHMITETSPFAFDGTFPHDGRRSTTGVAVLLNGAAVAWKTRKQTTVSLTSTEAEVKAMGPGIKMLRSLTDLLGELHH